MWAKLIFACKHLLFIEFPVKNIVQSTLKLMFRNNLKIALRSLLKQKIYTVINILGLSVGIASCILIVLFVRNEFSYDGFFANKKDFSDKKWQVVVTEIHLKLA